MEDLAKDIKIANKKRRQSLKAGIQLPDITKLEALLAEIDLEEAKVNEEAEKFKEKLESAKK